MSMLNKEFLSKVFDIDEWPRVTSVIIWMLGLFLMIGLTIKDLSPLVHSYYDDEENTQVQIKTIHDDFQEPDLFFCLPLPTYDETNFTFELVEYLVNGKECFICDQMASSSYDVWMRPERLQVNETDLQVCKFGDYYLMCKTDFVFFIPPECNPIQKKNSYCSLDLERTLVERLVDSILNKNPNDNKINHTFWSFNRPIIGALVTYLSSHTHIEYEVVESIRVCKPRDTMLDSGYDIITRTANANRLVRLYSILATFLCETELSFRQLHKGSGQNFSQNFCTTLFANASHVITFVGENTYACARLPLELMRDEEAWEISINPEYFRRFFDSREPFLVMTQDPLYYAIEYLQAASESLYATTDKLTLNDTEEVSIVYSQQSSVIEMRPKKRQTCYKESSNEQCELNSLMRKLESFCGCRSFMYRRFTKSSNDSGESNGNDQAELQHEYCNYTDYDRCSQRNQTLSTDCATETTCVDACRSNTYVWQVSASSSAETTSKTRAPTAITLQVQSRRQAYLAFTMKEKDTVEDFVSQIGGVFSFYLGFSGMSIVFVFVYLFNSARRFVRLRKDDDIDIIVAVAQPNQQQAPTTGNWLWRWAHLGAPVSASLDSKIETSLSVLKQEVRDALQENIRDTEEKMESKMEELRKSIEFLVQNITATKEAVGAIQCRLEKRAKKRK